MGQLGRNNKKGGSKSSELHILRVLNAIKEAIINGGGNTPTPIARSYVTTMATAAGSVPAGSLRGSAINLGDTDVIWNGTTLPAGVSIPWGDLSFRDSYPEIVYDATGSQLLIEYTI